MKALTLHQPWATLIAIGAKRIETRSWATAHTGPLAIHAAKSFPRRWQDLCADEPFRSVLQGHFGDGFYPNDLPLGCVVAVANLVTCHEIDLELILGVGKQERAFGWYERGRFAWILNNIERLPEPVPAKGGQRLWNWQPEQSK